MSYHRRRPLALSADTSHGPAWYRAMGGVSTRIPMARPTTYLGSLGDDASGSTTLSTPTISDQTVQWQASVLAQLQAGVGTMKRAELQKWLQIAATLSIPLAAAVWRAIFRRGSGADATV